MHETTRVARTRLLATTLLLALGATFACRPSWSPDGKQLLTPALVDGKVAIARYTLADGAAEVVFAGRDGARVCAAHWLDDGSGVVTLRSSSATDKELQVTVAKPDGSDARSFDVTTENDASHHMILPPVVVGRSLFLGGKRLRRVDLDDGDVQVGAIREDDGELILSRRGDGVCYVREVGDADDGSWEVGVVDAKTLATRPLFSSPDGGWRVVPMPVFTADLERVALAAQRGEDDAKTTAILVFADGELENVLELGASDRRAIGSLCWAPDDVTLYAVMAGHDEGRNGFLLHETNFSGNVTRDTWLLDDLPNEGLLTPMPYLLQMALSPDGAAGALSTAFLDKLTDDQHGLLVIDLKGDERAVTRLPFPK